MDFITESIAIGNHVEAIDAELLSSRKITAILCLARDRMRAEPPPGVEKDSWPLEDNGTNHLSDLKGALGKLDRLLSRHARVLVHCNAGRSRSCGLVALWITHREKISLDEAVARVAEKRSVLWITPDFRETLERAVEPG